jgi:hypothetical protein
LSSRGAARTLAFRREVRYRNRRELPRPRPQIPPAVVRRSRGPGARGPHARERHRDGSRRARVPLHGRSRGRQDDERAACSPSASTASGRTAKAAGPTAIPCQVCAPCREIAAGSDIDVQEIDGASYNGVDEVRRLQEGLAFRPARDRFKIYIVDEVHMLSNAAWNAFLKTLEEPPPHVKFIFATTEVHKVPVTILSRCQRYDFKLIATQTIADRLREVLVKESGSRPTISPCDARARSRRLDARRDEPPRPGDRVQRGERSPAATSRACSASRTASVLHDLAAALIGGDAALCLSDRRRSRSKGFDLATRRARTSCGTCATSSSPRSAGRPRRRAPRPGRRGSPRRLRPRREARTPTTFLVSSRGSRVASTISSGAVSRARRSR